MALALGSEGPHICPALSQGGWWWGESAASWGGPSAVVFKPGVAPTEGLPSPLTFATAAAGTRSVWRCSVVLVLLHEGGRGATPGWGLGPPLPPGGPSCI